MDRTGKVQTVLGVVDPDSLGTVLTHEHVSMDFGCCFSLPPDLHRPQKCDDPFEMRNLGWIRQNPYHHKQNLVFWGDENEKAIIEDITLFKKSGGGCIVENSTNGIRRKPSFFPELSKKTGVHVVAGAGYYVVESQTPATLSLSVEEMSNIIIRELTEGMEGAPGVLCGTIGEIGTSWPLHAFEKKSLEAGAIAQEATGSPLIIHPGRDGRSPAEDLRVLTEAGGDASKTVMSHLDRTFFDLDEIMEFSKWGTYLEYDLFGIEVSHYAKNLDVAMPSDEQRIQFIRKLINEGLEDRIVIAHDVHTKHRLVEYGGHGFSHINENVLPKMKARGITQEQIDKMTKTNPQRWLTFKK